MKKERRKVLVVIDFTNQRAPKELKAYGAGVGDPREVDPGTGDERAKEGHRPSLLTTDVDRVIWFVER